MISNSSKKEIQELESVFVVSVTKKESLKIHICFLEDPSSLSVTRGLCDLILAEGKSEAGGVVQGAGKRFSRQLTRTE